MISEEMINNLLRIKLKIADVILEEMPEPIRTKVKEHQDEFIKAVHQTLGEYLEKKPDKDNNDNHLRNITVDWGNVSINTIILFTL